ncbi:MAG: protease-4 [Myxococcota bacterium]|jgi:protease-4
MIGILWRLVRNLVTLVLSPLLWPLHRLTRPRRPWLKLEIQSRLAEVTPARPWAASFIPRLAPPPQTSLPGLRRFAERAAADSRVVGVIVTIPLLRTGWADTQSLRQVLERLVAAQKKVVVYLPHGGGNKELWLATAASRVLISPQASFGPLGLVAESRYIRPLLEKLGLRVEVEARREFKTAAETAVRDTMSPAQREQLSVLLGRMDTAIRDGLRDGRGLDEAGVDAVFEAAILSGQYAVDAGVCDGLVYADALAHAVGEWSGTKLDPGKVLPAARYLGWWERRFFRPLLPERYIAVVPVHGAITMDPPRGLNRGPSADLKTLVGALRRAARDKRALGVVLHVNSPGGSALASDLVHREVIACRRKKPVVAVFGDVAASGGYYIGVGAEAILAQPLTITGSIGVIMARVVATQLLDKLGVAVETVRLAPHADLLSPAREPDDAERAILAREADGFYEGFVRVVAEGRDKSFEQIEPLARGRVWSGVDAMEHQLVDAYGALDAAVVRAATSAGLSEKAARTIAAHPVRARRGKPPQPIAPSAAAVISDLLAGAHLTEATTLAALTSGEERALYYALSLPEIR